MFERLVRPMALVAALTFILPAHALAVTTSEIEGELMCQCGCQKVTINCDCGTADQMRDQIAGMIGQGKSRDNILNAFVAQYGETVLASPPKKGFNLVAYGVPMTGFFFGSVIAVTLARRWRSSRKEEEEEDEEQGSSEDLTEEMEERIQWELENLED